MGQHTHLSKLVNMRYNGKGNMREYTMEMSNLVSKLKELKLELFKEILVHFILISLLRSITLSRLIIMLKGESGVSLSSLVTVFRKRKG